MKEVNARQAASVDEATTLRYTRQKERQKHETRKIKIKPFSVPLRLIIEPYKAKEVLLAEQ